MNNMDEFSIQTMSISDEKDKIIMELKKQLLEKDNKILELERELLNNNSSDDISEKYEEIIKTTLDEANRIWKSQIQNIMQKYKVF